MRHRTLLVALLLVASSSARRVCAQHAHAGMDTSSHDSAYAAMQERGRVVMGVDQYTSTHHFDDLPNGGRITLVRNADDTAGAARIQQHLRSIATAFKAGDFTSPVAVHFKDVPGARVRRRAISAAERSSSSRAIRHSLFVSCFPTRGAFVVVRDQCVQRNMMRPEKPATAVAG